MGDWKALHFIAMNNLEFKNHLKCTLKKKRLLFYVVLSFLFPGISYSQNGIKYSTYDPIYVPNIQYNIPVPPNIEEEYMLKKQATKNRIDAEKRKNIIGYYFSSNKEWVEVRLHLKTDPATTNDLYVDGYTKLGSQLMKKCNAQVYEVTRVFDGDLVDYFNYKIKVEGRSIYF